MPSINCCQCTVDLGEIRDARIRKGTEHICSVCLNKLRAIAADNYTRKVEPNPSFFDKTAFAAIFKGKVKDKHIKQY